MNRRITKYDARLIGTWKSDRRRTFQHFQPKAGTSPDKLRQLKAMFGQLVIDWGRGKYQTELEGRCDSGVYEVIASDATSVVVRLQEPAINGEDLQQIHFDGNHYWVAASGTLIEWFCRLE